MNDAYAVMTIGTWILIQYDCSAGTAGIVPSFHVIPYVKAIAANVMTKPPANARSYLYAKIRKIATAHALKRDSAPYKLVSGQTPVIHQRVPSSTNWATQPTAASGIPILRSSGWRNRK